jgi:prepilin signal peptidase PulO-like enzyme (type II secretory pathway)
VSKPQPDTRSPIAIAYAWAWRVITISIMMVVPGVGGLLLDLWLKLPPVLFTLLGFGLGMVLGILQLLRIANTLDNSESTTDSTNHWDDKR